MGSVLENLSRFAAGMRRARSHRVLLAVTALAASLSSLVTALDKVATASKIGG